MKKIIIKLGQGQYIADLEPFKTSGIPSNSMVHKKIPGCGMTTFEIRFAKHHSIIILPNVPVIEGKVAEHNEKFPDAQILGVYKGIEIEDIEAYLSTEVKYKKILTTPEGFVSKVLPSFEDRLHELYNSYFLLYDECERIITDVSYRGKMAAPFDKFFQFTHKALVSATTLPFSDSRFEDFIDIEIKPDYDYSQPMTVISTNNVISSFKRQLDSLQSDNVCVFLNSTSGIFAIINTLDLFSSSRTFCARESVLKLRSGKYFNATSNFSVKDMKGLSFFTSRYFSAFDITLDFKPDVIVVSDIAFAPHSMLDPHTDIIQIAGRFRNGINSLTHIAAYNPEMEVKTPIEALSYLEGCLDSHEGVVDLLRKSSRTGANDLLEYFKENSPVASFYTDGKRNPFMIDNDLNTERVKWYYTLSDKLKEAYQDVTDYFSVVHVDEEFNVGDNDLVKLKRTYSVKDRLKQVAIMLDKYASKPGVFRFVSENSREILNYLNSKYPVLAEAHRLLGSSAAVDKVGYSTKALKNAITAVKKANLIASITHHVHKEFANFQKDFVTEDDVRAKLEGIYKRYNIKYKISTSHISRYYDARRTQKNGANGYFISEALDYNNVRSKYMP